MSCPQFTFVDVSGSRAPEFIVMRDGKNVAMFYESDLASLYCAWQNRWAKLSPDEQDAVERSIFELGKRR